MNKGIMKKRRMIIAAGICVILAIGSAGGYLFFGRKTIAPVSSENAPDGSADWMARLDGSRRLNEITLPGAHDSCAWNSDFSYFSQCQYVDTVSQLEMGIRYLDIRVSLDKGQTSLIMTHSIATCREGQKMLGKVLTLDKVLADCYDFLGSHPGETIVFCVKPEDDQMFCRELFLNKLAERPEMWYLDNRMPKLEEARGKLVLASRFSEQYDLGKGMALHWSEQDNREVLEEPFSAGMMNSDTGLFVQDRYCYGVEDKWNAVRYGLTEKWRETAGENALVLQFLSTKGPKSLGHPYRYAKEINDRLLQTQLEERTNYGWVIMDFAEPVLVKHIYEVNF